MKQIPVKKALFLIISSMMVTTLLFFGGRFCFQYMGKKSANTRLTVRVIAQHCLSKEQLAIPHLAEMAGLSVDKPAYLYSMNKQKIERRLQSFPIVKEASVSLLEPGVVFIEYSLREPIAFISDYENRAIDCDGYIFPVTPYLSPKSLPGVILGSALLQEEIHAQASPDVPVLPTRVRGNHTALAVSVIQYLDEICSKRRMELSFVDVQKAFSTSADQEIVLGLRSDRQYLVRVNSSAWKEGIDQFFFLYPVYIETALVKQSLKQNSSLKPTPMLSSPLGEPVAVDLRLPSVAYIIGA